MFDSHPQHKLDLCFYALYVSDRLSAILQVLDKEIQSENVD